jgi:general secretion pathway protein K
MKLSSSRRFPAPRADRGVALIIVLLVVFALTVTAATFAYQMRVETRLATTTRSEAELEWLGRSGVEYAKWILSEQQRQPGEQGYNGLNQFWAGGAGPPDLLDNPFEGLALENIQVGEGRVSIRIVDEERKFNINQLNPQLLELGLNLIGTDAGDGSTIAGSILDWIDRDDFPKAGGGAESDFYLTRDPPHLAKNGPIDDITELLKINGITPGLFFGSSYQRSGFLRGGSGFGASPTPEATPGFGLVDVFCALSNGQINVNTAPEPVLAMALGGDRVMAREVIKLRAGLDGVEGTEDDEPARQGGEIARLLGPAAGTGGGAQLGARFTTLSFTFQVLVRAEYGNARRRYVATIRRGGPTPRDFQTLIFRPE